MIHIFWESILIHNSSFRRQEIVRAGGIVGCALKASRFYDAICICYLVCRLTIDGGQPRAICPSFQIDSSWLSTKWTCDMQQFHVDKTVILK